MSTSTVFLIALGGLIIILLIAVNVKKKENTPGSEPLNNNHSMNDSTKDIVQEIISSAIPQIPPEIQALGNLDDMVAYAAPDNLNEKELKFFRKWFAKFHLNSSIGVMKYMEHVKKGYSPLWRDNLFNFSGGRQNNTSGLQTEDDVRRFNAHNMFESAEFILDELKLYDTPYTKKGDPRSQIAAGKGYLEKAIYDFKTDDPKAYKMYIMHLEKFFPDEIDRIPEVIDLAIKSSYSLSKTNSDWFGKRLKKHQPAKA